MEQKSSIGRFLDEEGRITMLPRKQKARLELLEYLTEHFELKRTYTEREVNEICERWNSFGDCILLRRELVDYKYLDRERDGSKYWRVWERAAEEQ